MFPGIKESGGRLTAMLWSCFYLNGLANTHRLIQHTCIPVKLQIDVKGQIKASKSNRFICIVAVFLRAGDNIFCCV